VRNETVSYATTTADPVKLIRRIARHVRTSSAVTCLPGSGCANRPPAVPCWPASMREASVPP